MAADDDRGPLTILFLCTGNSCRSQMAEGWVNHLHGGAVRAVSAGIEAHGLNPRAVQVMAEAGVDIASHRSKFLEDVDLSLVDVVITVCGHADETCPVLPVEIRRMHVGFDDPPKMAVDARDEEERLDAFRRVRDEIEQYARDLLNRLA